MANGESKMTNEQTCNVILSAAKNLRSQTLRFAQGDSARLSAMTHHVRHSPFAIRHSRAFTLVEMVIVVAVVLLLLGIVLPAASTLWKERRIAEAQNTISGMLMTARAKAMENDFGDSGLFFYLDDAGVQRIASITQDASKAANPQTRIPWANVFNILPERTYTMPVPMRAVPRYAVEDSTTNPNASEHERFSDDGVELANNDFSTLPSGADQAQRHRNFFTMIYSGDGQLRVRRDVLIRDRDIDFEENPGGDITALEVADDVTKYYLQDSSATPTAPIDFAEGQPPAIPEFIDVVVDPEDKKTALNFPSVDGLLVYDESLFAAAGTPEQKRQYLLDAAQPFYVHRLTGTVIRGPVGEALAKTP